MPTDQSQSQPMCSELKIEGTVRCATPEGQSNRSPAAITNPSQSCPSSAGHDENVSDEERARMQMQWRESVSEHMNVPMGYQKVAVNQLCDVFSDPNHFNYEVEVIELNNDQDPQLQLETSLGAFVLRHDGPHNLLIVYYSGHGIYQIEEEVLHLHASNIKDSSARACWNDAERALIKHTKSDVLAILGTCFAGSIHKDVPEDSRLYEVIAAAGPDRQTRGPGPKSFTTALIKVLKELVVEHPKGFTTWHLTDKITLQPERRQSPPHRFARTGRYDRNLCLAPCKPTVEMDEQFKKQQENEKAFLELRFPLNTHKLHDPQIQELAKHPCAAVKECKTVTIPRIDWGGLKTSTRSTRFASRAKTFSALIKLRRSAQQSPAIGTPKLALLPPDSIASPPMTFQKRSHANVDEDLAEASPVKRRLPSTSPLMTSPPISTVNTPEPD